MTRDEVTEAVLMATRSFDAEMNRHGNRDQAIAVAYERADGWLRRETEIDMDLRDALLIQYGKLTALLEHTDDKADSKGEEAPYQY